MTEGRPQATGWLSIGVGVLFGGGMLLQGAGMLLTLSDVPSWEEGTGRITASDVRSSTHKNRTTWHVEVAYTYEVDGERYAGDQIYAGDADDPRGSHRREDDARAAAEAYVPGSRVAVFHDPSDPSRAALVVDGGGQRAPLLLGMGGLILVLFVGNGVMTLDRRR